MGMWACLFYDQELCESDLITISVTTNIARFQRQPNWKNLCFFIRKNSHGYDNGKYHLALFRLKQ